MDAALPTRELLIRSLQRGRRVSFRLRGSSLEPLLHSGDVVLLEAADPRLLGPGDLVVYDGGEGFIAHRLLRAGRSGGEFWIRTAAERGQSPDPWIRRSEIIGRAVEIRPRAATGRLRRFPGRWSGQLWAWRTRTRCLLHRIRESLKRSVCG